MTQEELETMSNKIAEVAPDQLPVFLNNPDAFDYNVLEGYSDFTDKYKNVAEFIGDKSAIKAQIWKDLNGKFPSDARFQTLKDKYTWLNKEDLKKWFDKTNEYKKFYEDEARKEGEKNRRAKEVAGTYVNLANPEEADERNWGLFRNILTSDYEKQRYINEPETALFGYDAPELGKAPVTRSAAIGDLAAGTAATAADFVPSAWWLGPTIRMGRDLAYNISDSKYAKSKEDIAASIAADYGINATAKFLPNWRKGERVAAKASDPTVAKTLATVEAEANYKNSLNSVSNILETGKPNDIIKTIDALPEGEVKSRLIQYAQPGKPVNKQKIREEMAILNLSLDPTIQEADRLMAKFNLGTALGDNTAKFAKDKVIYNTKELTKPQKLQYYGNLIATTLNRGNMGQRVMQVGPDIYGRGVGEVKYTEHTPQETAATIDRLISSYSLLWNKNKEPAEAKNNPIIKAAWKKWSEQE